MAWAAAGIAPLGLGFKDSNTAPSVQLANAKPPILRPDSDHQNRIRSPLFYNGVQA